MTPKTSRIPMFDPARMTAEQARIYNDIISGPRGALVGPLRAVLHCPEIADQWQRFGELMRFRLKLPHPLVELAIVVCARYWSSGVEWYVHAGVARRAGIDPAVIDAIGRASAPRFHDEDERRIYEFSRQLLMFGNPDDETYDAVRQRWGTAGVVELTSLVGYYTMVSMTLNAHAVPVPEAPAAELLPEIGGGKGLVQLPPAPATVGSEVTT